MDLESLHLVLQLELGNIDEELDEARSRRNCSSDYLLALRVQSEALQDQLAIVGDRLFIVQQVRNAQADQRVIEDMIETEKQALSDREMAFGLAGGAVLTNARTDLSRAREVIDDAASVISAFGNEGDQVNIEETSKLMSGLTLSFSVNEEPEGIAGPSETRDKGKGPAVTIIQCVFCLSEYPENDIAAYGLCDSKHPWCHDCLVELFEKSTIDDTCFPPRCCQVDFPMEVVSGIFSAQFLSDFEERRIEKTAINPTYCFERGCSTFIKKEHIQSGVATCPACGSRTCTECKSEAHDGLCPEDPNVQALLEAARAEGWQICQKCKNLVELERGCNHLT